MADFRGLFLGGVVEYPPHIIHGLPVGITSSEHALVGGSHVLNRIKSLRIISIDQPPDDLYVFPVCNRKNNFHRSHSTLTINYGNPDVFMLQCFDEPA